MFTGIVWETGTVVAKEVGPEGARFRLSATDHTLSRLRVGESIAINGVCLTVTDLQGDTFAVEAVPQTLGRTNLGQLEVGQKVNLEPPLRVGDALGGHWVMGHIDDVGQVMAVTPEGNSHRVTIRPPQELMRYIVEKGSIAVDGVSLTVAGTAADSFTVVLIPHTRAVTTLGYLKAGDRVNLEVDVLGKYVERLLAFANQGPSEGKSC